MSARRAGIAGMVVGIAGLMAIALLGGPLASQAVAGLTLDIRLPGGVIAVPVTSPTQVIDGLQLWAVVTGSNANPADEGLWKFYASFYSGNASGGLIKGDLFDEWAPGTPFSGGSGASLGSQADLDGDGDLDIGTTNASAPAPPWFLARSAAMVTGAAFDVLRLTFVGQEWTSENPHGTTEIYAVGRPVTSGNLWKEDNVSKSGIPATGAQVVLYRPAEADAGGDYTVTNVDPPVLFSGSASTGTITTWAWDFNGDRVWDMFGEKVSVSFEYLTQILGMEPGVYEVTLRTESAYTADEDTALLNLVPEPGTAAMMVLGGAIMALASRRRA